jgi:hypothetical protein
MREDGIVGVSFQEQEHYWWKLAVAVDLAAQQRQLHETGRELLKEK